VTVDGRARWLLAGQDLLRRGGVPAVKLEALTRATGRPTGSFYHHFRNVSAYLDDLARFYGTEQVEAALDALAASAPLDRLRSLVAVALDDAMRPLDAAMRDWAGTDPVAAEAVRAADAALLRFLERAFRDLGIDQVDARVRAVALLSVGVARVHAPWPVPATAADRIVDLLVGP